MIKTGTFKFEELESKDHWVDFARFGTLVDFNVEHYKDYREVPIHLNPEKVYQMSLDQSTTNTGIFIKSYDNTECYMIERKRDKDEDADQYMFDLEMLIHQVCQGVHFTHLIYERPIITEKFRSSQVLFQLEGYIRSWNKRYDEFKTACVDYIESSSWKRVIILDDFKSNGTITKSASRSSIQRVFPFTLHYGNSINTDQDIYESMGVMFGWFLNSFDALGRPYVRGDGFNGVIGGFIMPTFSAKEVCEEFNKVGLEAQWYMQNPRKSTFENLAAAVEKYKIVCLELTDKYSMLSLCIECNMVWMDPDIMTVILVAANYADKRLFQITGKEYHFVV